MKTVTKLFIGAVLALSGLIGGHAQTPKNSQPEEERWQSIFDGKTLNGWKPSAPGFFTIEDGAITGKASREQTKSPVFIVWEGGKVKDFRLRFRCRVVGEAKISFRSQLNKKDLIGRHQIKLGHSVRVQRGEEPFDGLASMGEIGLLKENGEKFVSLFDGKDRIFQSVSLRDWNDYELRAIGQHSIIELNGQKVLELVDLRKEPATQSGIIVFLLIPSRNAEIQLKDIELEVSSQSESSESLLAKQSIVTIDELFSDLESGSSEKALQLLKQYPALIHAQNHVGWTPLYLAANRALTEVVEWLIANGANVNQADFVKMTPLHVSRTREITRSLIKAGADVDAIDDWYRTSLRHAAESKNFEVVGTILELGGKMDLVSAIYLDDIALIAKLIKLDPKSVNRPVNPQDVDSNNKYGNWSPLMVAVWKKDKQVVQMLLDAEADINDKNELGFAFGPPRCTTVSPLTNAISFKDIGMVELLLRNGADKNIDCSGQSLMEHVKENASSYPPEIIALLEKEWPKKN